MDRLIRLDNRPPQETEAVIRWCQEHPFWRSNILSVAKLRKQFDTLTLQMRDATEKRHRNRQDRNQADRMGLIY